MTRKIIKRDTKSIYHALYEHFGQDHQLLKAVEECCELGMALMHFRNGKVDKNQLAGEVADVYIMIEQLKYMLGPSLVNRYIDTKLERIIPCLKKNVCGGPEEEQKK